MVDESDAAVPTCVDYYCNMQHGTHTYTHYSHSTHTFTQHYGTSVLIDTPQTKQLKHISKLV